ncbi:hypothetical protein Oweho_0003 [Owenweeksia hongkongensis DSM 17368]|uniref:Uncharacterized protein n=1 Tax=Owenweeksia hongkongensis (strain DSM 17368 / CIP 108786 / JCM 12287 / NRRL B-23963 / UST20020801) TaxID=926562 RepID=G8R519_OWEHD|nr:hypothetical protein [Owenweeksia hongkongensis]AEV31030.1 hypothetical protein Oweho_0003 [Owenweeksia hongkongensis DSM 17368]
MRKIYRYKDLTKVVQKEEHVTLTVEFVTDGNTGVTAVNIPGPNDPTILNEGSANIGKGKDLYSELTACVTDVANPIPEEDTITVRYFINEDLLLEHTNAKSVSDQPMIILMIKFVES